MRCQGMVFRRPIRDAARFTQNSSQPTWCRVEKPALLGSNSEAEHTKKVTPSVMAGCVYPILAWMAY